jgi:hypothetical protein
MAAVFAAWASLATTDRAGWVENAPCAGDWQKFDVGPMHRRDTSIRYAQDALEVCRTCPFTRECLDRVAPHLSGFDGVCAGTYWIDGRAIHSVTAVA